MTNEIMKNEIGISSEESLREKFLTTDGRINRMTYFKRNLLLLIVEFAILLTIALLGSIATVVLSETPAWITAATIIVMGVSFVPEYCLNVKRLHDLGKDATLAKIFLGIGILFTILNGDFSTLESITPLINVLSIVSLGFTAYLLFMRGEDKVNQYGDAQ